MQGYIFPYISGRSSPNKYINKNFWGGSGQDKSIPKFQGGAQTMGDHGNTAVAAHCGPLCCSDGVSTVCRRSD